MQAARTVIAVLMTCHNRREQTLSCIASLLSQCGAENVEFRVFLVDDGSTDGTASAVSSRFPTVKVLDGDGSLYWTGGMRMAMDAASDERFDFVLWLNDDTTLYPDSITRLLETHSQLATNCSAPSIVVGSLRHPEAGDLTYGGSIRSSRWHPLRFSPVTPTSAPVKCDVFNGNCVLIPVEAVQIIGNLHPKLIHTAGDYEYGLRARRKGIRSWVAPGYFGECPRNPLIGTWKDPSMSLWQRYRALFGIKGQPPVPRLIYYLHYGGPLWIFLYPLVYLRPLINSLKLIFAKR